MQNVVYYLCRRATASAFPLLKIQMMITRNVVYSTCDSDGVTWVNVRCFPAKQGVFLVAVGSDCLGVNTRKNESEVTRMLIDFPFAIVSFSRVSVSSTIQLSQSY